MLSLPSNKKQFINRYAIVIEKFTATPEKKEIKRISKLIIESDNDPLVQPALRNNLKELYVDVKVYTFHNEGHFSYINVAEEYKMVLQTFFDQ